VIPIVKICRSLDTSSKSTVLLQKAGLGHNTSRRATACAGDAQEGELHPKQSLAEYLPKDRMYLKWFLFPAFAFAGVIPASVTLPRLLVAALSPVVSEAASLLTQLLRGGLPHPFASG